MTMSDIRKDAADAGGNAELLVKAAEQAADKFMYGGGSQREAFVHGFIDGARLMATILRPQAD